ncbi:hypothetical protein FJZ31_15825 [Candidatus Poribacteria bacterium]|nr:hypothetical protein [Candidatus Poribacteria bacterium]
MRILIIGAGGFGSNWWNLLPQRHEIEVVGLVDPVASVLEQAGKALKVSAEKHFSSIEEALEKMEADLDLHNTPPKHRPAHLLLLFERGIHVLAAKPLTETLGEAKQVTKLFFKKEKFGGWSDRLKDVPSPMLVESSVHHFDFIRSVVGANPVRIFAEAWHPWIDD